MDNLDAFAVVVEQKSLNRASSVLNISQPALSRKIMKLEEELGVRLFERKGKRLELTRPGQICYESAIEMRRLHREMLQTLDQYRSGRESISLTIGASLTTLQSTLPDLITFYTQDFPHTDIKALTGKTHEIVTLVMEQKVDIGLVASQTESPGLISLPLFDDHLYLVLPSGHPYLRMKSITMKEIHDLPMILFSKGTWYRVMMDELFHHYAVFPNVKMEIDSFEAIIRLVSTIKVATLLPKSYLHRQLLENNDLTVRSIPELEEKKRTTSLLFTTDAAEDPVVRTFIDIAREFFAQGGAKPANYE
ncbi:LysR family transcriptional regulator [Paenibacillus sp. J2TS4]|uniref:LysR family transcriptional regulator n=1 Tax=Paenibacillus sp. J2TS4 TaxID=2807194 RepID=UPI001AFD9CE5|nr:LysR family transcriptional regulator [Paenibacillus sp. J2TS4]GIP31195.1 LysR family transcriptional regulator [Paenibacillus sp. J2TS4]